MSTIYKYHINVNAEESEVVKKLLNSEVLLNRGKKEKKQVDFIKIDDPNGAVPGADVTLYVGINDTIDKIIYDAYCDPYTGHFSRFTEDGKAAYIKSDGTLDLEKVYDDLDKNNLNFLHLALEEALKNISEEDGESASAKRIGRRSEEGALATAPKPERERNHPLRDAFAKLKTEKIEEPATPVTGKLIDDYEGFKTKADKHLTNTSTRIDNMLGALNTSLGLDVEGLDSAEIAITLQQAEDSLNTDKKGLTAWKNGLQNVINQIPSPVSLTADQLTGRNETSRNKKIEEIKKGYANYKAKMEAKIEEADKVLALTEKVLKLEVKDFKTQLPGLRAELRSLQNPATPTSTGDDDEESVPADRDTKPTRAELRADRQRRKEEEKKRTQEAKVAAEAGSSDSTNTTDPLAQWAYDPIVGNTVSTFRSQKRNMTENDWGAIKLIKSAQTEFTTKFRAGDFTVEEGLSENEWAIRQEEVAQAIEVEKQALLEAVNNATTQTNRLTKVKQSASRAAQAAIDGATGEKITDYTTFKQKIEEAYDGLIYDINQAKKDIGIPENGVNEATGLFSTLDGLADKAVKVTAAKATATASAPTPTPVSSSQIELYADKETVKGGETVTVSFESKADKDSLSLTVHLPGGSPKSHAITSIGNNKYQAKILIPQETPSGDLKITVLNNDNANETGNLRIRVEGMSDAERKKIIGKLEITAKPSSAKPGSTVKLNIHAWNKENQNLEGANGDLKIEAKLSDGTQYSVNDIRDNGKGRYTASYKIPADFDGQKVTFVVSSKRKPEVNDEAQVLVTSTTRTRTIGTPPEDPTKTPDYLKISTDKQTAEPGEEVTVTFTLINKAGNSQNMDGYTLNINISSKPQITDNQNGTYTATFSIPKDTKDGTTFAVSGSIPTIPNLAPATANITVSLPTPTTAPDQFLGLKNFTGFTPPSNSKLPPFPKGLYASVRALWPQASTYSNNANPELVEIGKEANTLFYAATAAQGIAQAIWNSRDINETTKKAYLNQLALELKELSDYAHARQKTLSGITKPYDTSFTVAKMELWAKLESVKKEAIPTANDEIFSHTKPGYTAPRASLKKENINLLRENVKDPKVAEFLELTLAYNTGTKTALALKADVSNFVISVGAMSPTELRKVNPSDQNNVLLALREESKKLLNVINSKTQKPNHSSSPSTVSGSTPPKPKSTTTPKTDESDNGANVDGIE